MAGRGAASPPKIMQSDAMSVYKPDWREAKERLADWWAGKRVDRVVASVACRRDGATARSPRGTHLERMLDPPTIFANLEEDLAGTFYGGEAFPMHFVYLGAVITGVFFGCEPEFRPDTTWQGRLPFGWDQADRVRFDPGGKWWRTFCDMHEASCQRSAGRWIVSTGIHGALSDLMVNMFGPEETLIAMLERPAEVKRLRGHMLADCDVMNAQEFGHIARHQEGTTDWLRIWAPGRLSSIQSDVAVMLSPRTFNDVVLEELRHQCRQLDYSIYHLDGSEQWRHLDALLSIPELSMIQWNPEPAVSGDPLAFAPELRRVLQAGRKLYLYCAPERVRAVVEGLGREGIFLSVGCRTQDQAEGVLAELDGLGT